eukprot:comp59200_c0_seq1/m.47845 comp59200_c0_seq1/g.47845  ORF comp59200_c0_seq1/g.47845 comp59200_c0_seq1/m.47845 type:complete len:342 (+) comp59200_c0_seq1:236-1261(+)
MHVLLPHSNSRHPLRNPSVVALNFLPRLFKGLCKHNPGVALNFVKEPCVGQYSGLGRAVRIFADCAQRCFGARRVYGNATCRQHKVVKQTNTVDLLVKECRSPPTHAAVHFDEHGLTGAIWAQLRALCVFALYVETPLSETKRLYTAHRVVYELLLDLGRVGGGRVAASLEECGFTGGPVIVSVAVNTLAIPKQKVNIKLVPIDVTLHKHADMVGAPRVPVELRSNFPITLCSRVCSLKLGKRVAPIYTVRSCTCLWLKHHREPQFCLHRAKLLRASDTHRTRGGDAGGTADKAGLVLVTGGQVGRLGVARKSEALTKLTHQHLGLFVGREHTTQALDVSS